MRRTGAGRSSPSLLLACWIGMAAAQEPPRAPAAAPTYPIDLPTTLRLAGAQNLDVQLAHNAVDDAHANYVSALERFLPTLAPSASYLHHSGFDQNVNGTMIDVTRHADKNGAYLTAQIPVGDAIFTSLQTHQLVAAADAGAKVQDQDSSLLAAQQYFALVSAGALVEVVTDSLRISSSGEALRSASASGAGSRSAGMSSMVG